MSPLVKGLIFAGIGVIVQLIFELALVRPLLHLSGGATAVFAIGGVVFAGLWGFLTGRKEIYTFGPRPIWNFILDVSWSAFNTLTGVLWLIWCAAKGSFAAPQTESQKRGIVVFNNAALPGADATTIGNVIGGKWLLHEAVHVQQARIFGFLYWPTYLLNYLANLLSRFLTGRFHDPHWEAYGRVVMEDWAYHAAPDDNATSVEVMPSILWALLGLLNGLAVAVLIAPIPLVGALPAAAGLAFIPWWMGVIVLIGYAVVRSFFAKSEPQAAPVFA